MRPVLLQMFTIPCLLDAVQANAEPDFKQTGERLQAVVAGVIEGTMEKAVDVWALKVSPKLVLIPCESACWRPMEIW